MRVCVPALQGDLAFTPTDMLGVPVEHGAHEWTTREPFLKLDELIDGLVRLTITSDQGNDICVCCQEGR